jgi:hypothetical protein
MGDWTNKDACLEEILWNFNDIWDFGTQANEDIDYAELCWDDVGWSYSAGAMIWTIEAIKKLAWAIKFFAQPNYDFDPHFVVPYFLTNHIGKIDMLSLIAAMSIPTTEEMKTFICLEDAFRAAIWDKPYNPEYYALMVKLLQAQGESG